VNSRSPVSWIILRYRWLVLDHAMSMRQRVEIIGKLRETGVWGRRDQENKDLWLSWSVPLEAEGLDRGGD
jgi:hypothetical protein